MFCHYASFIHIWHLGFLAGLITSQCDAYTLPASFIIQEMAQKYSSEKATTHSWPAIVSNADNNPKPNPATMTLDQKGLTQTFEKMTKPEKVDLYFLDAQWSCREKTTQECTQILEAYLKKVGIDHSVVSLGIIDNEPAYILGAMAGDLTTPQLWLSKASFYPVKEKNSKAEISWTKWMRNSINFLAILD